MENFDVIRDYENNIVSDFAACKMCQNILARHVIHKESHQQLQERQSTDTFKYKKS